MSNERLTTLDASFLEVENPSAHMHVGWSALFAPPPGREAPSFESFRRHVAARIGRAPRYRQRLAEVPMGVNDPVWVDDERFDLDRHLRRARSSDFDALTDEVMSEQLDREHPLWELWITDQLDDGRIGVVGKAHHAMADGLAAVELASLLLDPTPDPPAQIPDRWRPASRPRPGDLLAEGFADRAGDLLRLARWPFGLLRDPTAALGVARDGLESVRALADSARPATTETPLNEEISGRRHLARAQRPLADLKQIKGRFGGTINDVVLAVSSGGIRRFFEQRGEAPVPLKAMVPVNVRDGDGSGRLGNQISFVFIDLPCDEPDPVRRLESIKKQIGDRKRSGRPEGASRALKAFAYTPRFVRRLLSRAAASPRTFNLVISNIPGPRESLYMLGCELEEVYPVVPIADRHALSIGLTTIRDQAFFGIYAADDSLPDADHLATSVDHAVEELLDLSTTSR